MVVGKVILLILILITKITKETNVTAGNIEQNVAWLKQDLNKTQGKHILLSVLS